VIDPTNRLLDLLAQEGRSFHALLTRLTLDPHAAEDLMQELFLKLATNPAFAAARNPPAYARQSAIHLALDWRRAQRPTHSLPVTDPLDLAPSAYERLTQKEQWSQLLDAAANLSGQTREAFVLHYLDGMSFAEIAGHLGKTPHQVRALCHKAVDHLRQQLSPAPQSPAQEVARAPH
jgi:RNA polymerase sigma factor (sigma-70 family)